MVDEDGFDLCNAEFFLAVLVRECPAAEAQRPDGAVHHRRSNLEVVAVGDRIIGFVDAGSQEMGNKLDFLSI